MKKFIILVPIDFSKSSYVVLKKTLNFAKKKDADIHIVHVVENPLFLKQIDLDSIKESTFRELSKDFPLLKKENYHCISGKIKIEINNTAKILDADMIIMGKSGETHFLNELFMGSSTKEIVNYAQIPVLVVKSDHNLEYQNILVLTDLSNDSAKAIREIIKIFSNSHIKLLNLFSPPLDNKIDIYGFNEEDLLQYQSDLEKKSQKKIDAFLDSLALPKNINISASAKKSSLSPKSFKEEMADINFDLIAIHAVQNNVSFFAFDILEHSDVDVFIVK